MYKIFKIENGKLREFNPWCDNKKRTKRKLRKIVRELNANETKDRYLLLCVG